MELSIPQTEGKLHHERSASTHKILHSFLKFSWRNMETGCFRSLKSAKNLYNTTSLTMIYMNGVDIWNIMYLHTISKITILISRKNTYNHNNALDIWRGTQISTRAIDNRLPHRCHTSKYFWFWTKTPMNICTIFCPSSYSFRRNNYATFQ